jgi:diphthamide synthase (EF-2-diphthine--ammonia ligase)
MQDDADIPVLTDLIEKGVEINLSELGLDPDLPGEEGVAETAVIDFPALEKEIRRILDEHMELAWQEIRIAIQEASSESSDE